jgi:CDP-diacylglycerol--glycerol-3-phosphate 3-phosphatidyltransferase
MLFVYDHPVAGLILGICAGLTDYLDGYLARRLNQETVLGAILDRLSDLIFEMCGFMFGVYFHIISPWLFIVYMMREVTVISARSFVSKLGKSLPTSIWGKLKTNFIGYSFFFIYLSVSGVIEDPKINGYLLDFGTFGLCCGLGFSYISGFKYLRAFRVVYNEHVDQEEQER